LLIESKLPELENVSTTLYISLEKKVRGLNPNDTDRVLLADVVADYEVLEPIARKLRVRSLSEFQSYDPHDAAEFIDDPEELKKVIASAPPLEWFDPTDGIKAIRAFREYFGTNSKKIPGRARKNPEALFLELEEVESVLEQAQKNRVRFRLHIGD
jgi:hypothetical protein